jgi:glycosyltransferase involved in cell wall biosynthesis
MTVNPPPLVSIIIPCYNSGALIQETIQSALNQPYRPIEIIVVNDGSTDKETLEVLENLPPEVIIKNIENSGPSVARNIAVKESKGKYIVPLDADDLILPQTISNAVPILEKNQKIGVVYGNNQLFGMREELKIQSYFNPKQIFLYNTIAFCSVIRKKAFEEVGGLDEWMSKKGLEDWEFWIKLYEAGWQFHYVNQTFFKIRVNENSRTFQVANKNLDALKEYVWKKHAVSLAKQYELLYHENKNFILSREYQLGNFLLYPFKLIKRLMQ